MGGIYTQTKINPILWRFDHTFVTLLPHLECLHRASHSGEHRRLVNPARFPLPSGTVDILLSSIRDACGRFRV
jgi:hypothetical protein